MVKKVHHICSSSDIQYVGNDKANKWMAVVSIILLKIKECQPEFV